MSESLKINDINLSFDLFKKDFILIRNSSETIQPLHLISKAIHSSKLNFIDEVINTEVEILLKLNDKFTTKDLLALSQIKINIEEETRSHYLPIYFSELDDWSRIEDYTGIKRIEYIDRLIACELTVAMLGFLPGFVYIKGLPKELLCPRKDTPTITTDKNSFAIAEHYCGIYSLESPGGWNIIGKVACPIINLPHLPPVLLETGDRIRIRSLNLDEFNKLNKSNINIQEYNEGI